MTKLKFLKKSEFFKILPKVYIKILKNRLILNKFFPEGRQVEAALGDPWAVTEYFCETNILMS